MNWKQFLKFPAESKVSAESRDLIRKLVNDVDKRIGFTGAEEIKNHPFFKGIDWSNIKAIKPLFVPEVHHEFDTKYFDKFDEEDSFYPNSEEVAKQISNDICFIDFDFERGVKNEDNLLKLFNDSRFIQSALSQAISDTTYSNLKFERKRTLETGIKESPLKPCINKQISIAKNVESDNQHRKKLNVKSSSTMQMPSSNQDPKGASNISLNKFFSKESQAQNNRSIVEINTANQGGIKTCKAKAQNKFNIELFSGEKDINEYNAQTTTNYLYVNKNNKGILALRKGNDEISHQMSSVGKNRTQERFDLIKDQVSSKEKIYENISKHQDKIKCTEDPIKSNKEHSGIPRSSKLESTLNKHQRNEDSSVSKASNISIKKKAHLKLDDDAITFNVNAGICKLSNKTSFTTSNTSNQLAKNLNIQRFNTGVITNYSMLNNTTFTVNTGSEVHLIKQASGSTLTTSTKNGSTSSKFNTKSNLKIPATTTNFKTDGLSQQSIKHFSKNMHSSSSISSKAKYEQNPQINLNQNDVILAPLSTNQISSSISTLNTKSHLNSNNIITKPTVQKFIENEGQQEDKVENNNYNINFNLNIISPKNINSNGFIFAAFNNQTSQAKSSGVAIANNHQNQTESKQQSAVKGSIKTDLLSTQKKTESLKKFINK